MSKTDLHELNKCYLIIVRDAVKQDMAAACAQFSITVDFANALARMTLSDITEVATTDDVLFKPAISGASLGKFLRLGDRAARTVMATMAASAQGQGLCHEEASKA